MMTPEQQEITKLMERVARLEVEIEWLTRPWWRRLFGLPPRP